MSDKDKPAVAATATVSPVGTAPPGGTAATTGTATPTVPPPPKRSPGHRGADVKDTVAEMAAKAQEISLEAGSKMAAAMKDVIGAAAGLTGFVIESARDLLQYMVRRGQMTQDEADKLMREVEASHAKRKPTAPPPPSVLRPPPRVEPVHTPQATSHLTSHASSHPSSHASSHPTSPGSHATSHPAPVHHAPSAVKHTPAKHAAPVKTAAKKPVVKAAAAKKHPVKAAAAKSKPKAASKAKRR
jgi:hypothetical protein